MCICYVYWYPFMLGAPGSLVPRRDLRVALFASQNIINTVNFECITPQDKLDKRLQTLVNR